MAEGWISSISLDWAAAAAAITTETCSPAASSLPPTSQTTSPTLTTSPWARTCFLHCTDPAFPITFTPSPPNPLAPSTIRFICLPPPRHHVEHEWYPPNWQSKILQNLKHRCVSVARLRIHDMHQVELSST